MSDFFTKEQIDILTKAVQNDLTKTYESWSSEDKLSWKEMGYRAPKSAKTRKINE